MVGAWSNWREFAHNEDEAFEVAAAELADDEGLDADEFDWDDSNAPGNGVFIYHGSYGRPSGRASFYVFPSYEDAEDAAIDVLYDRASESPWNFGLEEGEVTRTWAKEQVRSGGADWGLQTLEPVELVELPGVVAFMLA